MDVEIPTLRDQFIAYLAKWNPRNEQQARSAGEEFFLEFVEGLWTTGGEWYTQRIEQLTYRVPGSDFLIKISGYDIRYHNN